MLIVISPSKTLDYKPQQLISEYTQPEYLKESSKLISELRKLTPEDIAELMSVSPAISRLNYERYFHWSPPFTPQNAKQAILAFKGEVYNGLQAQTFSKSDFDYSQQHLRILSGLYGVIRPLDLIQPYRLEMGTKLTIKSSTGLYKFWNNKITNNINQQLASINSKILVNLASAEYFKSIHPKRINATIITPEFREERNGKYTMIVMYAKKARGMMTRYIIQNKLNNAEDIKLFNLEEYQFNPRLTKENTWVFTR